MARRPRYSFGSGPDVDLLHLFNQFDEDHSGEISYAEFFNVLEHLANGVTPSKEAVFAMLQDIDMDGSGSIDFNEFVEFFSRLDDMDHLLQRTGQRGKFFEVCAKVLFASSLVIFFTILMIEVTMHEDDFGTDYAKVVRMMRDGSAVTLGLSFLQSVLLPILNMRLGACHRCIARRQQHRMQQRKDNAKLSKATEKAKAPQGAWQAPPPAVRHSAAVKPPPVSWRPSKRFENSGASWSSDVPLPPGEPPPSFYPAPAGPPNFYPEPLPPCEPPPAGPRHPPRPSSATLQRLPLGMPDDPAAFGYAASAYDEAAWRQEEEVQAQMFAPPCHFNPLIHRGSMATDGGWPATVDHNVGTRDDVMAPHDVAAQRLALEHLSATNASFRQAGY